MVFRDPVSGEVVMVSGVKERDLPWCGDLETIRQETLVYTLVRDSTFRDVSVTGGKPGVTPRPPG